MNYPEINTSAIPLRHCAAAFFHCAIGYDRNRGTAITLGAQHGRAEPFMNEELGHGIRTPLGQLHVGS